MDLLYLTFALGLDALGWECIFRLYSLGEIVLISSLLSVVFCWFIVFPSFASSASRITVPGLPEAKFLVFASLFRIEFLVRLNLDCTLARDCDLCKRDNNEDRRLGAKLQSSE